MRSFLNYATVRANLFLTVYPVMHFVMFPVMVLGLGRHCGNLQAYNSQSGYENFDEFHGGFNFIS